MTIQKIVTVIFLTTILLCDEAIAGLELGPITVLSHRNEPFTAEMDLLGATTISPLDVNVQLAPKEQLKN